MGFFNRRWRFGVKDRTPLLSSTSSKFAAFVAFCAGVSAGPPNPGALGPKRLLVFAESKELLSDIAWTVTTR